MFGEIEDPRYSLYNGITNLSAVARTSAYLENIAETNAKVQNSLDPVTGQKGRGFFWDGEEAAKRGVNQRDTGIEVVKVDDIVKKLPGGGKLTNPLNTNSLT